MIRTATAIKQIEKMGFKAFHHDGESDTVTVSAEEGDGAADYYAMGDYSEAMLDDAGLDGFGINKRLAEWAGDHGLSWEWQNPGCIAAYPA